ncbi:MAG: sensor histidine kinase [Bacteroidales bacterium]|jgi:anti-sigma regulatory factor (Ser/Thr protein kinase)|nr:sensor histidine kinase [Bacteroidales bacterium]NLH23191.1 ATP-binding protein [Bacteroidales bacterium]HPJ83097.1 ATP-binding protein [Bacteroidales bacterium]
MNDLALHLLDIVQNSLGAGASFISIEVNENPGENLLTISVKDNGRGMSPEQLQKLSDPFFTSRTTRRVGLGVPLLRHTAEQSGGSLEVTSEPEKGTLLTARFQYDHLDRPPLGDVANAAVLMISANPAVDFSYKYSYNGRSYQVSTPELKEVLGNLPLNDLYVMEMIEEMIKENQSDLKVCQIE